MLFTNDKNYPILLSDQFFTHHGGHTIEYFDEQSERAKKFVFKGDSSDIN